MSRDIIVPLYLLMGLILEVTKIICCDFEETNNVFDIVKPLIDVVVWPIMIGQMIKKLK